MNAFESIIASLLTLDRFWVRNNVKVELTSADKTAIGRTSTPRWDIDVVAYRPADNLLWMVECKSYLDSRGVSFRGFDPETGGTKRYKLFNEPELKTIVTNRLVAQFREQGLILNDPAVRLCLAAPNIVESDESRIRAHFKESNWILLDRIWIVERLNRISKDGYEDSTVSILTKLLAPK